MCSSDLDEEKISLNPYYKSNFFDNQALKIIKRVIACKGKILRGFRQTEHGNFDMVTIMPSASTGKFEVICIERQFPKMDDPQKEKIVSALKDRYPSIMSDGEAHRATFGSNWDDNKPIMFWDNIFCVLRLTKVFKISSNGSYGNKPSFRQAYVAYENHYDDILLRNPLCNKQLAPKVDIE